MVVLLLVLIAIVLLAELSKSPSTGLTPEVVAKPFHQSDRFEMSDALPLEPQHANNALVASPKTEVCGLGLLPMGQSIEDLERANAPKIADAAVSLERRLHASINPRDQAAALMFSLMLPNAYALSAAAEVAKTECNVTSDAARPPLRAAKCDHALQQSLRVRQQETMRVAPIVAQLIQLVANTSDPAIYAQALHVCQNWGREMAACNVITVEQWVRLEPDNMQPWLQLAERADVRKDTAGLHEALFRASKAKTDRSYANFTVAQLFSTGTGELSELELRFGVSSGAGLAAAWTLRGFQAASAYCSAELVVDANRRQVCEALASAMTSHSESLVGTAIGARVGGQLGWSSDRVDSIRNQSRALGQFAWSNQLGLPDPQSIEADDCGMYQRTLSRLARTFEIGEMGSARELVLRRGLTVQEVTQAYLQAQATRQVPPVSPQSAPPAHAL